MKKFTPLILILYIVISTSCTDRKHEEKTTKTLESTVDKISYASGYANWENVEEIAFTFNVKRDTVHFKRSWRWFPKTNRVTSVFQGDTITYSRTAIDSSLTRIDASFINDRFWILLPFNLQWDQKNYSIAEKSDVAAPISGEKCDLLTIVYGGEGGYTPGDAYDIFYDEDHRIIEWVFRKGNNPEPSLTTTWENYQDFNGIFLASEHRKKEPGYLLYFSDIEVRN